MAYESRTQRSQGVPAEPAAEDTIACPHCGATVPESSMFCSSCGMKIPVACPGCGRQVLPSFKFCSECGAPIRLRRKPFRMM